MSHIPFPPQEVSFKGIETEGETLIGTLFDYGPVAHLVVAFELTPEQFDIVPYGGDKVLLAIRDFFYERVNKPCIVEFPTESLLVWGDESRFYVSHPTAFDSCPFMLTLGRSGSEFKEIQ